jgi:ribonuclease-3
VDRADSLAEQLGLPVSDRRLLAQALTHSSWLHEHPGEAAGHNERLEFLGDAVINLAVSEALYARHPDDDEGILSARRAAIVSAPGLAALATRIDLGAFLALGEGEAARSGPKRPSILASAFEALAGALLLDVGWERTRDWLLATAAAELDAGLAPMLLKSPKSRLQEATQRTTGGRPAYRVLEAVGPDHDKIFRVEVAVGDEVLGMGIGPSRRVAETAAAAEAVEILLARAAEAESDAAEAAR